MTEHDSSFALEHIQSLLYERNAPLPRAAQLLTARTGIALPDNVAIVGRSFNTEATFPVGEVTLKERLLAAGEGAFSNFGNNPATSYSVPNTGGFYRAYFHVRGVVEMFPDVTAINSVEANEWEQWFGCPVIIGFANQPTERTITFTCDRLNNPDFSFDQDYPPLCNLSVGGGVPSYGSFFVDRVIAFSALGNGGALFYGGGLTFPSFATSGSFNKDVTLAPGVYPFGTPGRGVSAIQNTQATMMFRNNYGNAPSLYGNFNIIRAPAFPSPDLGKMQYLEAKFLGFYPEPSLRPQEIIELQDPIPADE